MKVDQITFWDITGGAARAAYRIHCALRQHGVDSRMYVRDAISGDWTVEAPGGKIATWISGLRRPIAGLLTKTLRTEARVLHSPGIFPSRWPKLLNNSNANIIHLHWLGAEMMSIADIAKVRKPIVWTLHDMWAFCGAEHITGEMRWHDGYRRNNRPSYESGFDLNRWTWQRKLRYWRRPMHIVAPSRWMAECVEESVVMRNWPVSIIPNPIDTDAWQLIDRTLARQLLRLPSDAPLLLFGAIGGTRDPNKGFDLLKAALGHLRGQLAELELVVLGQLAPKYPTNLGFPVHYTGHLHDEISLRLFYSAADAVVVPSRIESLSNCGIEARACGPPVVAVDVCGLLDVVTHKSTGYLAKHIAPIDLARGIQWVLNGSERRSALHLHARQTAEAQFSFPVVGKEYMKVYQEVIGMQENSVIS